MGNCQAVDNATIAIQYPNGRVDKLFCPVPAADIMRLNPGHYVALLLTTTLYSSTAAAPAAAASAVRHTNSNTPLRVTRIKLLRPSDILALGHVYRLVSSQEVMKGLCAKKQGRMQKNAKMMAESQSSYFEIKSTNNININNNNNQAREERHSRGGGGGAVLGNGIIKGRTTWQPALKSISEASLKGH